MNRMTKADRFLVALWTLNFALACASENLMAATACAGCIVLVLTRETRR